MPRDMAIASESGAAVSIADAPQTESLTVCGSLRDDAPNSAGWLVASLTPEWVGAAPRAVRELRHHADLFQLFHPQVRILVAQSNREPVRRLVPAFPGYLFVLPVRRPQDWHILRRMPGILGVLNIAGAVGTPYHMPPQLMGRLLSRSKAGIIEDISVPAVPPKLPPLDPGTRCRITGGYMDGMVGTVDRSKQHHVRVMVDGLGMAAVIRRDWVEELTQ